MAAAVNKLLEPVRHHFATDPHAKAVFEQARLSHPPYLPLFRRPRAARFPFGVACMRCKVWPATGFCSRVLGCRRYL